MSQPNGEDGDRRGGKGKGKGKGKGRGRGSGESGGRGKSCRQERRQE